MAFKTDVSAKKTCDTGDNITSMYFVVKEILYSETTEFCFLVMFPQQEINFFSRLHHVSQNTKTSKKYEEA